MFHTRDLKDWISRNIHNAERLLAIMRRPTDNPYQIKQHVRLLETISGLTYSVEDNLFDLSALGRDYANDAELQDFGNSIIDIGRRASAFYKDLCAREASISNANTDLLYARKAVHEGMERRQLMLASQPIQSEPQLLDGRSEPPPDTNSDVPSTDVEDNTDQPGTHPTDISEPTKRTKKARDSDISSNEISKTPRLSLLPPVTNQEGCYRVTHQQCGCSRSSADHPAEGTGRYQTPTLISR